MKDDAMREIVWPAAKRLRKAEAIMDSYIAAGDPVRADLAYGRVLTASDEVERSLPTTMREVTYKFREAVAALRASEYDSLATKVRAFACKTPRTIDGAWLRDLRALESTICREAPPDCGPAIGYAAAMLRSIIAALGRPRFV